MIETVVLVGCGQAKRDEPAAAKRLYTSTYFQKKREVAETLGDEWRILSAKHGLVKPDDTIHPYDASLNPDYDSYIGDIRRAAWSRSVARSLEWVWTDYVAVEEVLVLAGQHYTEPLKQQFPDEEPPEVRYPFDGLGGIPGQMRWMADQLAAAEQ